MLPEFLAHFEIRELATNVTTTYKASYVDHAGNTYTIFVTAESSCMFRNFLYTK